MTVAGFLIHPLGERDANFGMARGDNLANAMLWFRVVKDSTRWAICYPTMAYLAAVDDVHHGPSTLTDHIELMKRMDVVIAVGGAMSPHMRYLVGHAKVAKIPVLDLLDLGSAPRDDDDSVKLEIIRRAEALGL